MLAQTTTKATTDFATLATLLSYCDYQSLEVLRKTYTSQDLVQSAKLLDSDRYLEIKTWVISQNKAKDLAILTKFGNL